LAGTALATGGHQLDGHEDVTNGHSGTSYRSQSLASVDVTGGYYLGGSYDRSFRDISTTVCKCNDIVWDQIEIREKRNLKNKG
jgi:hypothetical protein